MNLVIKLMNCTKKNPFFE